MALRLVILRKHLAMSVLGFQLIPQSSFSPLQRSTPLHALHSSLYMCLSTQAATAVGNGTAGSNGHSHAGAVPGPGQHQPNAQQHLPPTSPPAQQQRMPRVFCMSPDAPVNPSYYWIGDYDPATHKFDLEGAAGPFRLDIGDILYAPNTLLDPKTVRGSASYAGPAL